MNVSEPFKKYAETVCAQIRWKKAHPAVTKEIENHLIDQKNAYLELGDSESIAEEKALLQMGDPVAVGAALDSTHKPAPQKGMIALVLLLSVIGVFLQLQYFPYVSEIYPQGVFTMRVLFAFAAGITAFLLFYFLDFSFFGKHPYCCTAFLLGIVLLTQLFGLGINGQKWLHLGNIALSPMMLSLLFPLVFSSNLYALRSQGRRGYLKGCVLALFWCIVLSIFTHFGSVILFLASANLLLLAAAYRNWFGKKTKPLFFLFVLLELTFVAFLVLSSPYRSARIFYAFHPEADAQGYGYVASTLREMLSHSVFFGKGTAFAKGNLFAALPSNSFPADYLLAVSTYRYGWLIFLLLIGLLAAFFVLGFRKCLKQKSILGQMTALSILSAFAVETIFYVLANLGFTLITSGALPFLSYGINAAFIHMALAGILLSVFRTGEVYQDGTTPTPHENKFIQWTDGKLILSFK